MSFKPGDRVVYPHHGAAVIEKKEKRKAFGEETEYLVLRMAHGEMTLAVPVDKADEVGMRWPISEEDVESLARAFDPADDSQWMMRIRGDEGLARRAIAILENGGSAAKADRWWMGMVERPLVTRTVGSDRRPFIRMWFEPDGGKRPESTPDASRN